MSLVAHITLTLPTQNTDGSTLALSDIESIHIYVDQASPPTNLQQVVSGPFSNANQSFDVDITSLGCETLNFAASVVNTQGVESAVSSLVTKTYQKPIAIRFI